MPWSSAPNCPSRSSARLTTVRDSGLTIDDGGAGYSATGFTTKNTSGAYQGDQSTAAAGTGSKTATWTFTGLHAGASYKVTATWRAVSGSASNAPFTISDGGTPVATVAVNEQIAPADFSVSDTSWKGLGTYTLTGNTLRVQLSNQANGTVVADAVRIFEVVPPPPQIGSFTASPNPAKAGASVTLTASTTTDGTAIGTVTQVAFYVDSNGDGILEPGTDALLGYATQTSPGVWTFAFTVGLAPGSYTLFAQAEDSFGVLGDLAGLTLTVQ
jgi:hypothetical protein